MRPVRATVLCALLIAGPAATLIFAALAQPATKRPPTPQERPADATSPAWADHPAFRSGARSLFLLEPLRAPVAIRIRPLEGRWGQAWFDPRGPGSADDIWRIELSSHIPGPEPDWALAVLAHEWAHCMTLEAAHEGPHDALWGVALARCYRALYGE